MEDLRCDDNGRDAHGGEEGWSVCFYVAFKRFIYGIFSRGMRIYSEQMWKGFLFLGMPWETGSWDNTSLSSGLDDVMKKNTEKTNSSLSLLKDSKESYVKEFSFGRLSTKAGDS